MGTPLSSSAFSPLFYFFLSSSFPFLKFLLIFTYIYTTRNSQLINFKCVLLVMRFMNPHQLPIPPPSPRTTRAHAPPHTHFPPTTYTPTRTHILIHTYTHTHAQTPFSPPDLPPPATNSECMETPLRSLVPYRPPPSSSTLGDIRPRPLSPTPTFP